MKRTQLSQRASKKIFTTGATFVHPKNNLQAVIMRGGYRL